MKNKFDIVYESIVDQILQKAQVNYQLVSDFQKRIETQIEQVQKQDLPIFVKQIKREIKWNDPSKDDKIEILKNICVQKFNDVDENLFK